MHICVYVCMYVRVSAYVCMYVCMCVCVCFIHVGIYVCQCAYVLCMYVCMYACICAYIRFVHPSFLVNWLIFVTFPANTVPCDRGVHPCSCILILPHRHKECDGVAGRS